MPVRFVGGPISWDFINKGDADAKNRNSDHDHIMCISGASAGVGCGISWSIMSSQQFIYSVFVHSVKSLNMVNCRDRRIGILNGIYYSQRGGKGKVVWTDTVER